jgi:FdhE protein
VSRPTGPSPGRAEPREIVELRRLKSEQPDLASAVDLQIALLEVQRRMQPRVPLPWVELEPAWIARCLAEGHPLLRFEHIPLNWTDFRLVFRQTAEVLRRFDAVEPDEFRQMESLSREGDALPPLVMRWYAGGDAPTSHPGGETHADRELPAMLQQVLQLAARPFLARCAEVLVSKIDLASWTRGLCPLCGGEPEFAVITQAGERLLICGRCTAQWRYPALACPFCENADRSRITSFASRDGHYRISACDVCRRYLKAYDARHASRGVLVAVDSIATLPLDAAAMQKGYLG